MQENDCVTLTKQEQEIISKLIDFILENEGELKIIYNKLTENETIYYVRKNKQKTIKID